MSFNLEEIRALMTAEEQRRKREAPQNIRDLHGWLIIACALPMAAIYEPMQMPDGLDPVENKNRVLRLWENDAMFHHAVNAQVSNIMAMFTQYLDRQPLWGGRVVALKPLPDERSRLCDLCLTVGEQDGLALACGFPKHHEGPHVWETPKL